MKTVYGILIAIILGVGISLLISLPVMWLWNGLMPEIFGLTTIGFKQALGLSVFSSVLFKSSNSSIK